MLAALARQIARAARERGREALFASEMRRPDMRMALEALQSTVRLRPDAEHGITISRRSGGPSMVITNGREASIPLPVRGLDGGDTATFLHNHPLQRGVTTGEHIELPLSMPDHFVARGYEGMYGSRGFGRMAQVSSVGRMTRPEVGSIGLPSRRMQKLTPKQIEKSLIRLLDEEMNTTIADPMDYAVRAEAANRALARLGLIRYGSRYSGDTRAALRARDRAVMRREDEIVRMLHGPVFGLPYPIRMSHLAAGGGAALGAAGGAYASNRRR